MAFWQTIVLLGSTHMQKIELKCSNHSYNVFHFIDHFFIQVLAKKKEIEIIIFSSKLTQNFRFWKKIVHTFTTKKDN